MDGIILIIFPLLGFWGYKINKSYPEGDADLFFYIIGFLIGFFFNIFGIMFLYMVKYIKYH
jgi:hypothetical protein